MEVKEIKQQLKEELNKHRYKHTVGVSYTAICLAMRYEVNLKQAELAGLLHDCAKCIPDEQQLAICMEQGISVNETEQEQPYLLHAKLGAFYAKEKYGITDEEILNAIRLHTTGAAEMTMLEKIIFTADYIEPERDKAKNLAKIRKMAFIDIDTAIYMILRDTLNYLEEKQVLIDAQTREAYLYFKGLYEKK